jgi:hypothetical protein
MVQVNLVIVMGVLIILTGIALVGIQIMESNDGEMHDHSFKLIGAEAGGNKLQVETSFPSITIIALGMVLLIVGTITSREH